MNADQAYYDGWVAFREFCGENIDLQKVLTQALKESLRLNEGYTLIDVGGGDGSLVAQLLKNGALGNPRFLHFVEPNDFMCARAEETFRDSSLALSAKIHHARLADLRLDDDAASFGLVLAIHAAYYFQEDDIARLVELRDRGFGVLLLASLEGDWVVEVNRRIGNPNYQGYQFGRFESVVRALGGSPSQIRTEILHLRDIRRQTTDSGAIRQYQLALVHKLAAHAERDWADELVGFFAHGWEGAPRRDVLVRRVRDEAMYVLSSEDARKTYSIFVLPP
jgi:hypothetical protein